MLGWVAGYSRMNSALQKCGNWIGRFRPAMKLRGAQSIFMPDGALPSHAFYNAVYTFNNWCVDFNLRSGRECSSEQGVTCPVQQSRWIACAPRAATESLVRPERQAARKLFVERGYDATRPQDIAREAGLGHGTFYLHYPDKRACFLSFVEDARLELDDHLRAHRNSGLDLEQRIAATLSAIYEYADRHPGVLRAAMSDERVIDTDGEEVRPLLMQWGAEWAEIVRCEAGSNGGSSYDADIIGQAIVGALHQAGWECQRSRRSREQLVKNLTAFLLRGLRPG